MLGRSGRRILTLTAVAVCALAGAAVALASPFSAPVLVSPHTGGSVAAGTITLIVKDPGVPKSVRPVFVQISRHRKLDKNGFLARCLNVSKGCDFIALKPRNGHPGEWIAKSGPGFPGYWATTPGKYYWQANHTAPLCQAKGCEVVSKIHSFRVR